jgi:hypothetical protein
MSMRAHSILLAVFVSLAASGCKDVECGTGTIERNGRCEPSDTETSSATCGPFTMLVGTQCVPQFPPTVCDDTTTDPDVDPATGVTTCIGTGTGGCDSPIPCPAGTTGTKQTICGQLYDFETNAKLAAPNATGVRCDPAAPTADGPCALNLEAYNAIAFASDPQNATPIAVPAANKYIDDCGRYRLTDIDVPSGPFIGLGVDDASGPGPSGVTVTTAIATPTAPMTATRDLEAWIVKPATAMSWATSGGPTLQTGVYALIFRQHKLGNGDPLLNQDGVQVTKSGVPVTDNDFYFPAQMATRTTMDPSASVTGSNGTGFVNNASVTDGVVWGGTGGLGSACSWEPHAGASLPGIVFIQVFRKIDASGQTCNE